MSDEPHGEPSALTSKDVLPVECSEPCVVVCPLDHLNPGDMINSLVGPIRKLHVDSSACGNHNEGPCVLLASESPCG